MATIQNLKTDETVISSNVSSDPNISLKLNEEETAYHSNSDEITLRRINGSPPPADVYSAVSADNGELLDDTKLESEVTSFIDEYQTKELGDLDDESAVVISKLRSLYKKYSARISRAESINYGIATKYGIRKGMLLNIEKNLLQMEGKKWIVHFTQEYGQKSLRTAQDYMALAKIPNILDYAVFGKERLIGALRAIKALKIESENPIATLFQQCGISFNPEDCEIEETMMELKLKLDYAVAISKIKNTEEKKKVDLKVNPDHIEKLIGDGIAISNAFINDLFEINSEGRDVNTHLEGLCNDSGDVDEMLPHIKKAKALPKLVEALKSTVESIRQHGALVSRIKSDHINDLENCVVALKNIAENRAATE